MQQSALLPGRPLVLAVALVAFTACQKIDATYCRMRLPPSQIVVTNEAVSYSIGHHQDARAIGDAHGQDGESITYGLTTASPLARAEIRLHVLKIPGGVCARPDVLVHLAYQPMTVEIARELPEGSCGYQAVLNHEMKHVDVFRQTLDQSAASLRHEIDAHALDVPVRYSDVDHARAAMQSLQDSWLLPMGQAYLAQAADLQSAVDTPAEYQRVKNLCPSDPLISGENAPDAHRF